MGRVGVECVPPHPRCVHMVGTVGVGESGEVLHFVFFSSPILSYHTMTAPQESQTF